MPSKTIYCKDCQQEKQDIELGGVLEVISCTPLTGEQDKPQAQQKCKIVWKIKSDA
jgi:hypothetical protein